jgi:hypothetical protein
VVVLTLRLGIHVAAADTLGLPFVRPYLSGRSAEDFASGANFAVGGATALSPDFFRARGFDTMGNKVDLDMEMKWFRGLLDLLCPGNLAGMYVLLHLLVSSSSMLPPHLTGSHALLRRRKGAESVRPILSAETLAFTALRNPNTLTVPASCPAQLGKANAGKGSSWSKKQFLEDTVLCRGVQIWKLKDVV